MMMSTPLMRFWLDVRSGLISYWSKIPHEELIIDQFYKTTVACHDFLQGLPIK